MLLRKTSGNGTTGQQEMGRLEGCGEWAKKRMQRTASDIGPDGIPAINKKGTIDLGHHRCFSLLEAQQLSKGTEGKE